MSSEPVAHIRRTGPAASSESPTRCRRKPVGGDVIVLSAEQARAIGVPCDLCVEAAATTEVGRLVLAALNNQEIEARLGDACREVLSGLRDAESLNDPMIALRTRFVAAVVEALTSFENSAADDLARYISTSWTGLGRSPATLVASSSQLMVEASIAIAGVLSGADQVAFGRWMGTFAREFVIRVTSFA